MLAAFKDILGQKGLLDQKIAKRVEVLEQMVDRPVGDNDISSKVGCFVKTKTGKEITSIMQLAGDKKDGQANKPDHVVRWCDDGEVGLIRSMHSMVRAGPIIKNNLEGGMLW